MLQHASCRMLACILACILCHAHRACIAAIVLQGLCLARGFRAASSIDLIYISACPLQAFLREAPGGEGLVRAVENCLKCLKSKSRHLLTSMKLDADLVGIHPCNRDRIWSKFTRCQGPYRLHSRVDVGYVPTRVHAVGVEVEGAHGSGIGTGSCCSRPMGSLGASKWMPSLLHPYVDPTPTVRFASFARELLATTSWYVWAESYPTPKKP